MYDYTFSIKEVLSVHMHKKHNGATPVLNVFVHLSYVTRSKESYEQEASRLFEVFLNVISVIFLQRAKVCLSIMNVKCSISERSHASFVSSRLLAKYM